MQPKSDPLKWFRARMPISRSCRASSLLRTVSLLFCAASGAVTTAQAQSAGPGGLDLVCPLVEHERQRDLEDHQSELELVENEYHAISRVFDMVEKLWKVRSIEREAYLDYKRRREEDSKCRDDLQSAGGSKWGSGSSRGGVVET